MGAWVQMSEWISVKERLPEKGTPVLACCEGGRVYICALPQEEEYNEHWCICEDACCSCIGTTGPISHWMNLPGLPKD